MYLQRVLWAAVLGQVMLVNAIVTMQTIRDITNTTNECRARISGKEADAQDGAAVVGLMGGLGQTVLSAGHGGDEDGEDVEDVSLRSKPFSRRISWPKANDRVTDRRCGVENPMSRLACGIGETLGRPNSTGAFD
jgi:hypothetical protein